jgi:hypothetical protein
MLLVARLTVLSAAAADQWSSPVGLAPCDPSDPQQHWQVDGDSRGSVRLFADGRCLQSAACATAELAKAVVDRCDSPCGAGGWTWEGAAGHGSFKYATGTNLCLDTDISGTPIPAYAQVYHCKPPLETPGFFNQDFLHHAGSSEMFEQKASPAMVAGTKQCAVLPCCLSAGVAPADCFSAGPCRSISGWGWSFSALVAVGLVGYLAGGVLYSVKVGRSRRPALSLPAVVAAHPHAEQLSAIAALVSDGPARTRATVLPFCAGIFCHS